MIFNLHEIQRINGGKGDDVFINIIIFYLFLKKIALKITIFQYLKYYYNYLTSARKNTISEQ